MIKKKMKKKMMMSMIIVNNCVLVPYNGNFPLNCNPPSLYFRRCFYGGFDLVNCFKNNLKRFLSDSVKFNDKDTETSSDDSSDDDYGYGSAHDEDSEVVAEEESVEESVEDSDVEEEDVEESSKPPKSESVTGSEPVDGFDDVEGDVKNRIISNIFDDETSVNDEYVEKGVNIINRDTDGVVKIERGGVVSGGLYDVGSDASNVLVTGDGGTGQSKVAVSRKGIDDIVGRLYKGVKVQLDEDINLHERLVNIRRWYKVIDGEVKSMNRYGFVNYHGFVKECPNLMNVLTSFID